MAKKRSRNPTLKAFGGLLEGLRGKQTREWISIRLNSLHVPLGGSTLAQYEKGTVWAPDPGVMWGLSQIYTIPLEDLVGALRINRLDVSLDRSAFHRQTMSDTKIAISKILKSHQTKPDKEAQPLQNSSLQIVEGGTTTSVQERIGAGADSQLSASEIDSILRSFRDAAQRLTDAAANADAVAATLTQQVGDFFAAARGQGAKARGSLPREPRSRGKSRR